MVKAKQCDAIYLLQDTIQKLMIELEIIKLKHQNNEDFELSHHLQRAGNTLSKMKNEMVEILDYYPRQ